MTSTSSLLLWGTISTVATILGLGVGVVGTILGWIGFVQIRGSNGGLRGIGLALFAGLFYPIALLLVLVVALIGLLLKW